MWLRHCGSGPLDGRIGNYKKRAVSEIDAIGPCIVHGGELFAEST